MPSSPNYQRDYKEEYQNYQGKPEQISNRAKRNAAHKLLEKVMGREIKMDVDHKTPLVKGGSNVLKNLRPLPASRNRSFKRGPNAEMV